MMKETQADFGLTSIETSENEAQPYTPPVKVVGDGGLRSAAMRCGRSCSCAPGKCRGLPVGSDTLCRASVTTAIAIPVPAPRARALPTDGAARKRIPMYAGLIVYFPDALAAVARRSWMGNEQHHPGTPVHWDKTKSTDHADCIVRHLTDYADSGETEIEELEALAWRAMALLQTAYDKRKAAAK